MFSITTPIDERKSSIYLTLCIFGLAVIMVMWRFLPWMPHVFAGDDLASFLDYKNGHFASSFYQALTAFYYEKYRPVLALTMFGLATLFDKHITWYLVINILIQGINATLVYLIALKLSRNHWIIAGLIALCVAVSRFALYQVVQVTGLVEGLALVFFLLTVYFMLRAEESKSSAYRWCWLAIISLFLTINTHERYIVVIPWLIGVILLFPNIRLLSNTRKIILIGTSVAILLVNIIYKKFIMHTPFFVGTGGSLISIKLYSILLLTLQAIFSIFGFNWGPEYLIGIKLFSLPWFPAWILAIIFSVSLLLGIIGGIYIAFREQLTTMRFWSSIRWPLSLIILFTFLLAPPITTTHLEQRWLLEPFILMLLLFAWALHLIEIHRRLLALMLALVVCLSSIILDSLITPYFKQIFFVASSRFAMQVKQAIVDKEPSQTSALVLIAPKSYCSWVLINGEFFRLYGGTPRTLYCFDTPNEALSSTVLPANIPIYGISGLYSSEHLIKIRSTYSTATRSQAHVQ